MAELEKLGQKYRVALRYISLVIYILLKKILYKLLTHWYLPYFFLEFIIISFDKAIMN